MARRKLNISRRTPKIGPAIQRERKQRKLTLEQLAIQSGVSKSMLSQIERGEANPTFAVLWSLTQALEIELSTLVGASASTLNVDGIEVTTAAHTPQIRSSDGLCRLKILSSPRLAGETEWYDLEIDPGGALDSAPHTLDAFEHFTALSGSFEIVSGVNTARLRAGETARYPADVPHRISNVGAEAAHGFLVVLYQ